MHILWLSHLLPYPPKGGVQQRSFNLLREVAKRHDVTLLAFNQPALSPTREAVAEAERALGEFATVASAIDIRHDVRRGGRARLALRSLVSKWPYSINWLNDPSYAHALNAVLARAKFDAAHFDTLGLAPYLEKISPLPAILNHHNIESDMMLRRAELESGTLKRLYFRQEGLRLQRYEQQVTPRFALNVTCSALDGERLQTLVPNLPYEVIPNGVDLDYFSPREALGGLRDNSALFAGGLAWYPNESAMRWFLNDIWPLLADVEGASMTIAGRKPPSWLKETGQRLPSMRVTGFVDDIRPYMEEAAVYVCPIFDGGGTKLKMLDAMAMGKAIVAHPIACEGIDIVHGEHVLMAEDPREFARLVAELWKNRTLRQSLGDNARRLVVQRYSFGEIGGRLAGLFEGLRQAP
jgi:glycosyltransferase involved in cell wall biosynthesis